jgi:hypothetical protein
MSISIYYKVLRTEPLTDLERASVDSILRKYSVDEQIRKYLNSGQGLNWESFCIYPSHGNGLAIFEGATKLPDNTKDATWIGVQHWCAVLSEIRRGVDGATWRVAVEDHEIAWDETSKRYDPGS